MKIPLVESVKAAVGRALLVAPPGSPAMTVSSKDISRTPADAVATESEARHLFRYARPFLPLVAIATLLSVGARGAVLVFP